MEADGGAQASDAGARPAEVPAPVGEVTEDELRKSTTNASGYVGVARVSNNSGRWQAMFRCGYLGTFSTPREAAVAIALRVREDASSRFVPAPAPVGDVTEDELRKSSTNESGYFGVYKFVGAREIRWQAKGNRDTYLGSFSTPREAAVAIALHARKGFNPRQGYPAPPTRPVLEGEGTIGNMAFRQYGEPRHAHRATVGGGAAAALPAVSECVGCILTRLFPSFNRQEAARRLAQLDDMLSARAIAVLLRVIPTCERSIQSGSGSVAKNAGIVLRLVRSHLAALLFPLEELQLLPPPKRSQAYALRQQTRKFVDGQHYKGAEHELKACSPCKEAVVAAKAAEQTRLNDRRRLDEIRKLMTKRITTTGRKARQTMTNTTTTTAAMAMLTLTITF